MLNYITIYSSGVFLSSAFVLVSNDIFYHSVIKKLFVDKKCDSKLWDEIKPREIYGNSAKHAFLDPEHSLINDDPNQTSIDYNEYLFKKKYEKASPDELKQITDEIAKRKF
jgi:hypothetical protein